MLIADCKCTLSSLCDSLSHQVRKIYRGPWPCLATVTRNTSLRHKTAVGGRVLTHHVNEGSLQRGHFQINRRVKEKQSRGGQEKRRGKTRPQQKESNVLLSLHLSHDTIIIFSTQEHHHKVITTIGRMFSVENVTIDWRILIAYILCTAEKGSNQPENKAAGLCNQTTFYSLWYHENDQIHQLSFTYTTNAHLLLLIYCILTTTTKKVSFLCWEVKNRKIHYCF